MNDQQNTQTLNLIRELQCYTPEGDEPEMNDWELNFLESLDKKITSEGGKPLFSDRQAAKVDAIWKKTLGARK